MRAPAGRVPAAARMLGETIPWSMTGRFGRLVLALAVLGLVAVATPLVGTAGAEACRVGDVDCYERKAACVVGDPEDPLKPRACTA